ncbi:MAG: hypothetical protein Q9163_002497 [Psora crenata]
MKPKSRWRGHCQYCSRKEEVVCAKSVESGIGRIAVSRRPQNTSERAVLEELGPPHFTTPNSAAGQRSGKAFPALLLYIALSVISVPIQPSTGHFIPFDNCLSPNIINSNDPKQLQFVPLFVWAAFNSTAPSHDLNVTVYGNVDGIARQVPYPPPGDRSWGDPKNDTGKIPDLAGDEGREKYTTFTAEFDVLNYTPYHPDAARFCNTSVIKECPWAPVFNFSGTS